MYNNQDNKTKDIQPSISPPDQLRPTKPLGSFPCLITTHHGVTVLKQSRRPVAITWFPDGRYCDL
jgi:hypothetical protein